MKKTLVTIGGVVILALVTILFVNARDSKKDVKKAAPKAAVESAAGCGACPSAAGCTGEKAVQAKAVEEKPAATPCDPAACPEHSKAAATATGMKECDPAACPEHVATTAGEMKDCDPATCPEHAVAKK